MKPATPPPTEDAFKEVPGLIDALHRAERRLEEVTAGEVDTVTDREGRTYFLRRAQDKLRHSEAARQVAILNALPAHIALLDPQGLIVSVNEAWRQFTATGLVLGPGPAPGADYLAACGDVGGGNAADARQAAAGIRSVLDGGAKSFSLEYFCHSEQDPRWFLLTVTPLADERSNGAVIMYLDITQRKRNEQESVRFSAAMDATSDAIFILDRSTMRLMHVNDAACRLQEQTRGELMASGPIGIIERSRAELEQAYDAVIASGVPAKPQEILRHRKDGSSHWIELRRHATRSEERWMMVSLIRDITERKTQEDKIARLSRIQAVLSGINTLIVRVRNRDELFREACRIAVNLGAFRMAWIGTTNPATLEGKVESWYGGEPGYVDRITFNAREGTPESERPTSRVLRNGQPVICNDVANDPDTGPLRDEILRRGHKSFGCFPLIVAGRTCGVLSLFAGEPNVFDSEETRLVLELAGDISFAMDHIEQEEKLNYLAYYDALTGLANRSLFLERVSAYMRSAASGGYKLALYLVDLERFKNINDSLGQAAGDTLLRQVGEWLTRNGGDANLFARVGADLFAAVLPEVRPDGDLAQLIEKIVGAFIEHPFRLNDSVFRIGAKTGIAIFPEDADDADSLFKNAEAALKKAKSTGERYLFYTQTMTDRVASKLTLENQLRQALDREEFVLHYQPKVNLASGKVTSVEALIRWNDPRTGLVPPGHFIPVLEETGLVYEVGRWALRKAIADHLRWRIAGLRPVRIAVNVSPLQLRNRGFVEEIRQVLGVDARAAAGLELEITESLIMEDVKHNIASLQAIRAMGVTIAIDDFGTGFSSLSYLSRLPVDTLKIDRSFVIDMTASPEGLALVSTIVSLAHALKLKVVAEGVETEEQSRLLRLLDCDEMQGYLFSKPEPVEIFESRYLGPDVKT